MAKSKIAYFCQSCGYESAKWLGKCPSCQQWNTFVEEILEKSNASVPNWKASPASSQRANKPVEVGEITFKEEHRLLTPDKEFNRVLGGGIVAGSLVLIGGEPGIGKSTLMLQLALNMPNVKVLYVSGEESDHQIKMRAERLVSLDTQQERAKNKELKEEFGKGCFILTETSTQNIFKQIEELQPDILVIDSIQTLHSSHVESTPGSVSQVRECTAELLRFAKETSTPVFLIGHITKDGMIAGPKILEHMVDTVLQFEGDRHHVYRILRTIKNRFGSSSEIGIYEMLGEGLREVSNPSEILLSQRDEPLSGITISATLEGLRPMLIETQALVSTSAYGTPQRTATGFDTKRMSMLLAVLEKRCGFRLGAKDVFLNITGGIRVEDPAIDLGLAAAIISSHEDIPIPAKTCFAGEIGLSGEIRAVNRVEQRIAEAQKLGFEQIFISKYNMPTAAKDKKRLDLSRYTIDVKVVGRIEEVFGLLFG
ncbi:MULTISPECIES: DNA repair protein RadA [unclassified Mucilaginibacter]|uniref:DNA repair protein RadA n=1 Tax=unclassified Mucilaginibacter TaxID=2617802 RepID=UPI002AC9D44D|nr:MULTISPECIES: DNA repair protein RadA [unclassified Mucilaginibacter]MEB0262575.1 DNA repair protein RadA [Mucilaginibacter sp. 10I4]MEB0278394.1 DNA repair protein RadA [Mucilaginibacter sp. 10B2]MEB0302247.1 DNA repair protein RadA [Mucilaginibacter sp. 5C4]WPX24039.1 DNA repair protein RadA [Mucilaginibacter sp. 5C4]